MLFMDFGASISGKLPFAHFSKDDILALASDIDLWKTDIDRFNVALVVEGPPSQQIEWNGPKPSQGFLAQSEFRSLRSLQTPNRRPPTHGKS